MKEYIDRAAAKDEILSWAVCINHPELLSKEDTMYCIDNMPAADVVEVRHGRWIGHAFNRLHDEAIEPLEYADYLECSICKANYYRRIYNFCGGLYNSRPSFDIPNLMPKFCPNCGARMDEEDDHEAR